MEQPRRRRDSNIFQHVWQWNRSSTSLSSNFINHFSSELSFQKVQSQSTFWNYFCACDDMISSVFVEKTFLAKLDGLLWANCVWPWGAGCHLSTNRCPPGLRKRCKQRWCAMVKIKVKDGSISVCGPCAPNPESYVVFSSFILFLWSGGPKLRKSRPMESKNEETGSRLSPLRIKASEGQKKHESSINEGIS